MTNASNCTTCNETPEAVVTGSDGAVVCVECHADAEQQ